MYSGSFVISLSCCMLQWLSTVTLRLPAFLPEFSSSLQCHAEVVSWTAGERCHFTSIAWIVLSHFTFINFELVGVSHASISLWGYSLSCGIPIKLIIQISYIKFDCIQIGILQIIDYRSFTKSILELASLVCNQQCVMLFQWCKGPRQFLSLSKDISPLARKNTNW
jgi:hypothetical protein